MDSSRSMLRIFVGCTSVDLQKHRDAARHVVDLFDEDPVLMGDFGARDGDATEVSLERVHSCAVYIPLLAWRYGTILPNEMLSVAHLEYRAARAALFEYLEVFYNRQRRHSVLGYFLPIKYGRGWATRTAVIV